MGSDYFKTNFLQYPTISEAPKSHPRILLDYPAKLEAWILEERERWYRAEDRSGNIWKIKNPLTWEEKNGFRIRPKPELLKNNPIPRSRFEGKRDFKKAGNATNTNEDEVLI